MTTPLLILLLFAFSMTPSHAEPGKVLFDFSNPAAMRGWQVEDDGVMGGVSRGNMLHDKAGHAILRLKGDGKDYRFIVESDPNARHYYVAEFGTNGDWQEIKIPLRKMYPMCRGDRLDIPDYPAETMAQVRLMIANGRAESFQLEIASIRLE